MVIQSIYDLALVELERKLVSLNLKKHNATQIFQWIYQKQISDFSLMSNIAKSSVDILKKYFYFPQIEILKTVVDEIDETTKFLIKFEDGECVETVLMKFNYGYSVCISSQIGCAMGCKFCASGLLKKVRNLTTSEILLQYLLVQKYISAKKQKRISNLVVMGIGEPLDNYENLRSALQILTNHYGVALGSRHITVSTCGMLDKIMQFAKDFNQINLAVSLHAPNDEIRNKLMPINKKYPIVELMKIIKKYVHVTNRRISFEYLLLKGINDSEQCAHAVGKLLKGLLCYVNIIIYNNVDESGFQPSKHFYEFMNVLKQYNVMSTKRLERGTRISAACGQLRARNN